MSESRSKTTPSPPGCSTRPAAEPSAATHPSSHDRSIPSRSAGDPPRKIEDLPRKPPGRIEVWAVPEALRLLDGGIGREIPFEEDQVLLRHHPLRSAPEEMDRHLQRADLLGGEQI